MVQEHKIDLSTVKVDTGSVGGLDLLGYGLFFAFVFAVADPEAAGHWLGTLIRAVRTVNGW